MTITREDVIFSLNAARHYELELCGSRFLAPVIKLGEPRTHMPWLEINCPAITIKVQDLLNESGRSFKPIFERIKAAGGIHAYLGFEGNVILSSIMKDKMIRGFSIEQYAELIRGLKPEYYITPDGETYFGKKHVSAFEINRMLAETSSLLDTCPESTPIGLVKGCNINQIEYHTNELLARGVYIFAFHAGDFMCSGTANARNCAIRFASEIRKKVQKLIIYGIGSSGSLNGFCFADGYITQSHFVTAFYGKKMAGGKWWSFSGSPTREIIMQNLRAIEENIIALETRPTLMQWSKNAKIQVYTDAKEECIEKAYERRFNDNLQVRFNGWRNSRK